MDAKIVRQRIRTRRQQLRMHQEALGAAMQARGHDRMTRECVGKIERGILFARAHEVPDFCAILRCPPWWLLGMNRSEAAVLDAAWRDAD